MAFCPNCGKEVSAEALSCPNCGHSLKQISSTVTQPATIAKPDAAFVLSLIGGIFTLVLGTVAGAGFAYGLFGSWAAAGLFALFGGVSGVLIIIGAALQFSTNQSRVRTGSILVLVFTIIAVPFTLFGVLVGFILSLIGAILGLRWKPLAQ